MKIFLTGGTGFIGQPLARRLQARGWTITALVRQPDSPPAHALLRMGARCVVGDITDRQSMRQVMAGAEIVIHNAGWYELGIPRKAHKLMYAANVAGTDNVLSLALELRIPRTVYVSSTLYYGDTGPMARDESYQRQKPYSCYYEQTKVVAHQLGLQYIQRGLPLILVCPANVLGANDHSVWGYFVRLYLNHLQPPFAWAADTINTGVHVNDAAEGIALAAEKGRPGETYILAGDPMRTRDILAIWMTKPGGAKTHFYLPTWLAAPLFWALEPLQRRLGLPAFISRETALAGDIHMFFSSAKAQAALGWRYRQAREMWEDILDRELELLAKRRKNDIASRLNPLEMDK